MFVIVRFLVLVDNFFCRSILSEEKVNSILKGHRFLLKRRILTRITLHKLVDFDAFEGANLSNVLFNGGKASTDSHH